MHDFIVNDMGIYHQESGAVLNFRQDAPQDRRAPTRRENVSAKVFHQHQFAA